MVLLRPIQSLLTGALLAAVALAQPLSLVAVDRVLSRCAEQCAQAGSCDGAPPVCGSCPCAAEPAACCDPLTESDADPTEELLVRCLIQGCTLLCQPPADASEKPSAASVIASAGAGLDAPMGFSPTVPVAATGDPPTEFQRANATERRALTCVWTT